MSSLICYPPSCSLLCTATYETPHEQFFGFSCRSCADASIPTRLATPRLVYIKHQVRTSKMDPLVDEMELLQASPHYAHVRYAAGRETTVATKHLAPKGKLLRTWQHQDVFQRKQRTCPLTHVWVLLLMQNHRLGPNLNPSLHLYRMRNLHLSRMWNLHPFVAPDEFVVLQLDSNFKDRVNVV